MRAYTKTVPVRVEVDVSHVRPQNPVVEDSPLVSLRARISLAVDATAFRQPLWVDAEIQLSPNHPPKLVWMDPIYGNITGFQSKQALVPFKDALMSAIKDTRLKILGVK